MDNDQAYDEGYRAGMQKMRDSGHKIFMALARKNDDIKAKLEMATKAMSEALGAHDQTEAEWIIKDALAELTGEQTND